MYIMTPATLTPVFLAATQTTAITIWHGIMEVSTDKPDKYKPWRRINEFKEEKKETRSHTLVIYTLQPSLPL